jgi:CubicO group peptidase (beta-lactamase class C family)
MKSYLALVGLLLAFAGDAVAQAVESLVVGQTYERTLGAGETHTFTLPLEAGRFVSGRVDQHGVDVAVTVTGPNDERVPRFDAPGASRGTEHFRFTTAAAGPHRIQVAPAEATAGGRYTIRLDRAEPLATDPGARVDQIMAMFDTDTPGAVVAVVREGELAFARAYGMADLTHDVPFTVQTVTNIGSTSKQFTGFALALLASRGVLSLDDDVRKYIPELPDFGETITLRNLLTHTTGFREYVNTLALGGRQVLAGDYVAREEVIDVVQRQPRLQNAPGTEFNYNNTAYGLATVVVERATGQPFPEWMAAEVFRPLGMNSTTVRAHPGEIIPNRSVGYSVAEGGFREVRDLGGSMGAGGIYTTVGDLARWMRNLRTAELGGPEVMRQMTTRTVLATGDTTSYGLGLFIDTNRGLRRVQHGGSDVAHRSTFVYYPDLRAGYVVLSNHGAIPGSIAQQVAEAFFGEHMTSNAAPAPAAQAVVSADLVRPELLEAYVGRYELEAMPGLVLTVSRDDEGRLLLQVTGQPAGQLTATSDSTFTLAGVDASVTFHRADGGEVDALTLHQNGNHRARRVPDAAPVDLGAFVGRFFSAELETVYDLAIEDGALVVRHRRFDPVTLAHSKDDTFTGSFPIGDMSFERDGSGRVTGFRVGNVRARDIWFERQGPVPTR